VDPDAVGRGIADQIPLAGKISPSAGSHRLAVARALWFDLPETFTQLTAGELSEQVAECVVQETRHLDAATRQAVDARIAAARIATLGPRAAAGCARRHAYEADPQRYPERGCTERKHRRVGIRPAPDTMAILRGYLLVEHDVACYASLSKHADTLIAGGDPRTRDQIMADTLVEPTHRPGPRGGRQSRGQPDDAFEQSDRFRRSQHRAHSGLRTAAGTHRAADPADQ
jgi:hypothetical protein